MKKRAMFLCALLLTLGVLLHPVTSLFAATDSGSVGIEGVVPGKPPAQGATISVPTNGQSITQLPVTVSGICPTGLLVKLYKNNVFSGSAQCTNGSFSIISDLFTGRNELVARVFDALDQEGPVSNTVVVTYTDPTQIAGSRVTITSNYAKRGANPKERLVWPLTISGGTGPYAVSVDWGDKTSATLYSREFPGDFNIEHVYEQAGIYNVVVKVTDKNGVSSFLQLVAVANGPVAQNTNGGSGSTGSGGTSGNGSTPGSPPAGDLLQTAFGQVPWWPLGLTFPFIVSTFWLGKRHQLHIIRKKLQRGDRPF